MHLICFSFLQHSATGFGGDQVRNKEVARTQVRRQKGMNLFFMIDIALGPIFKILEGHGMLPNKVKAV